MVKYNMITLDEKSGQEKKVAIFTLVQAADFDDALANFRSGMNGTLADFEIVSITETMIMDVFPLDLEMKSATSKENTVS